MVRRPLVVWLVLIGVLLVWATHDDDSSHHVVRAKSAAPTATATPTGR